MNLLAVDTTGRISHLMQQHAAPKYDALRAADGLIPSSAGKSHFGALGAKPARPIGVFDSGVGGLSVLAALLRELPQENFVYFSDAGHAPYGERGDSYLVERSRLITRQLIEEHQVKALVVACNTATGPALHLLRQEYPGFPIVGLEPALTPAATLTRTGRIAVFATRSTLSSTRVRSLQESLLGKAEFVLQLCDALAAAIEAWNRDEFEDLCSLYVRLSGKFGRNPGEIDTVVLGCTHYVFIRPEFEEATGPGVQIIDSGEAVARQTKRLLNVHGIRNNFGRGHVVFRCTGSEKALREAAGRWLPQSLS